MMSSLKYLAWNIDEIAPKYGLHLLSRKQFAPESYPGYTHRMTNSNGKVRHIWPNITYTYGLREPTSYRPTPIDQFCHQMSIILPEIQKVTTFRCKANFLFFSTFARRTKKITFFFCKKLDQKMHKKLLFSLPRTKITFSKFMVLHHVLIRKNKNNI